MHPIILEASATGFVRLILIILFIYALFSFLMRRIVPLILRKYVNDFQNRFTQEQQRAQEQDNRKKEGEVSIKYMDKDKNTHHNPDEGEYVDYEEIK